MSVTQAVSQLIEVEESRREGVLDPERTLAIALSRVGGGEGHERIVAGTLAQLRDEKTETFGEPLHSVVIVGKRLHHLEAAYAESYAIDAQGWRNLAQSVYGCNFD